MAVIKPVKTDNGNGVHIWTWTAITTADTGDAVESARYTEKTFHVIGAGNAQIQGSNDGTNYVAIGSAAAANSLTQIAVNPRFLNIGTVAAATVTIILVARHGSI